MSRLDEIERPYRRALEGFLHLQNDALDDGDNQRFERIEDQIEIRNAGFVVVIFGQIESALRDVYSARVRKSRSDGRPTDKEIDDAFRRRGFLDMAEEVLGKGDALLRPIARWYDIRGDIAHGRGAGRRYQVSELFEHARAIESASATLGTMVALARRQAPAPGQAEE
jgi:hypothetical protein